MSTHLITDHGASGDGVTDNAAMIQAAIDAVHKDGGGTVLVPSGKTFRSGSFSMRANVNLHVESGATLLGATDEAAYPLYAFTVGEEAGKRLWIGGKEAHGMAITGGGVIDGDCRSFGVEEGDYGWKHTLKWRPAMTCFEACKGIRIRDLTFRNAANWALHFSGCEDITVTDVAIRNDLKFPNCDGIDPDHCRNVRISGCHIEAGDDCIVLKNTLPFNQYGPCENVTVTGCTLVSTSSAIKIGTESRADFRNLVFTNCVIRDSNRGLSIQLRDNGDVENVILSDMTVETRLFAGNWWGSGEPIYITALPRAHGEPLGKIRNVRLRNLLCKGENGAYIHGFDPSSIENVLLENVRLELVKTSRWEGGRYDTRPCPPTILPRGGAPIGETTPWGVKCKRRSAGVYIENATGVTLRHSEVVWGQQMPADYGHALEAYNAPGLDIATFQGEPAQSGIEAMVIG